MSTKPRTNPVTFPEAQRLASHFRRATELGWGVEGNRIVTESDDGSYTLHADHHATGRILRAVLFGPDNLMQYYRQDGQGNVRPCESDEYWNGKP